jgi:starch synthase
MVMLGSGIPSIEGRMREMEKEYPDHFRGWVGFSIPVAHRIIAGADIILMPSRFEPCGLNRTPPFSPSLAPSCYPFSPFSHY